MWHSTSQSLLPRYSLNAQYGNKRPKGFIGALWHIVACCKAFLLCMTAFDKLCLHCFITFHYELLTVCAVGGRYGLNRGFTVMWWLTILVIVITSHLNLAGECVNVCCRVGLGRSPQLKSDSEELSFSNRSLRLSCLGCRTVYCCKWDLGFWKISPAAFPHRSVKWLMWEHPSTIRGAF